MSVLVSEIWSNFDFVLQIRKLNFALEKLEGISFILLLIWH